VHGERRIVSPQDSFVRRDQDDTLGQPDNDLLELLVIATRFLQAAHSVGGRGFNASRQGDKIRGIHGDLMLSLLREFDLSFANFFKSSLSSG
jgi:hypothetical protein